MIVSDNGGAQGVYTNINGTWSQANLPLGGIWRVGISGSNMIAGDGSGTGFGVWTNLNGSGWSEVTGIGAPPSEGFWGSVAISGTNMIVGDFGSGKGIYTNVSGNWAAVSGIDLGSGVWNVGISGTNMIAGDLAGKGVIYTNTNGVWTDALLLNDLGSWNVAISDSNMIAGDGSGNGYGVWTNLNGSGWSQVSGPGTPPNEGAWNVAISGFNLIVGDISTDFWGVYFTTQINPCLLPNSKIKLYDNSYKEIQNLNLSDKLKSPFSDKPQTIKQIIKNSVSFNTSSKNMPIHIPKSFLSENVPFEDVYISGHHRIIIQTEENKYTGVQAFKLMDKFLSEEEVLNMFGHQMVYYHIELEDPGEHLIVSDMFVESYQKYIK
jgi:hypothetical protein